MNKMIHLIFKCLPLISCTIYQNSLSAQMTPFECNAFTYQTTGSNSILWRYNTITGNRTEIGPVKLNSTNTYVTINGMGYNTIDNYIWGSFISDNTAGKILKLGSNGNAVAYTVPNLLTSGFITGDVDLDGHLYLYKAQSNDFYTVDISSSSPHLVDPTNNFNNTTKSTAIKGDITSANIADWAYNKKDGNLYGLTTKSANGYPHLICLNPKTAKMTDLGTVSGGGIATPFDQSYGYGAAFFNINGDFTIVSNNNSFFFNVDLTTRIAKKTSLSTTSISLSTNDGAGCVEAPPTYFDLGDAPDTYQTSIKNGGPTHLMSDNTAKTTNLMIGNTIDAETDVTPNTSDAEKDDNTNTNDEDGLNENSLYDINSKILNLTLRKSISLTVTVTNKNATSATLAGWIDFNQNGQFDDNERAATLVSSNLTQATLTWTNLDTLNIADAKTGSTYLRLRLATASNDVDKPIGDAADGEVEDYKVAYTNALPVTYTYFASNKNKNAITLEWQTANEQNNKGFFIERSPNTFNFSQLGFVDTKATNGNSNSAITYQFIDASPLIGTNYYRLKQVDLDGQFKYSTILKTDFSLSQQNKELQVYPNPVKEGEYVHLTKSNLNNQDITVILVDNLGHIIYSQIWGKGTNTFDFGIPANTIDGIYYLRFVTKDKIYKTQKLIIRK